MMLFCENKAAVAQFVNDQLSNSRSDWPLTMTITPVPSGGFYALCATGMLSDGTERDLAVLSFLPTQVNT